MKPEGKAEVVADKNVMPSMVVRQQRMTQTGSSANQQQKHQHQTLRKPGAPEEPSYVVSGSSSMKAADDLSGSIQQQIFDQDGLVLPKRVVHHPVSVAQPIIRDLNRELKFNQIRGKNVLDQKSELKKALEKLEESKRRREAEQERLSRRTSLELRLEERAEKIAKETGSQADGSATCNPLSNFSIKSVTR